ncbi:Ig-like domain-containing protein [Mycobacterium sp. NBC_00419]|uniref:Ig-like domain-containing protein n=1 Tax=Mycobacterium sp. NBC_00419 TaxID=2975989 RepID=UPI002E21D823
MNRAAAASLVIAGMSLAALPAAGVASAAPGDGDTAASSTAHPGRPQAKHSPATPSAARHSTATSARGAAKPVVHQSSTARSASVNPIVAALFNRAPTLRPTQDTPGLDGIVHGALNATDPDGDSLTYTVVRDPVRGQIAVDNAGNFTYTSQQLSSTDTFTVRVSDAESGLHLHGLMGLINLLTFGLIGSAGHTTTRVITVSVTPGVDTTAYILPVKPDVNVKSVLTVGDSPSSGTYPMVGSPDGLGLFDNSDGTFTLLMNHELASGSGSVRAHGAAGAFISRYVIDKATLDVVAGADLIQQVFGWNAATQSSDLSSSIVAFNRFCSGDLAAVSAYSDNGLGSTARIFLTGEEGGSGRAVATVASGPDAGKSYILGAFSPATNGSGLTGTASWENLLANPFSQAKTVVIGNNDGGSGVMAGALAVYVGTKQSSGTEADKAGLTNGVLKFVTVAGNAAEIADAATRSTGITSGTAFTLSSVASTSFSRPEDGAWNPLNPNEYYFATTDRLDQVSDGVGGQVGRSRLWRLTFSDIANPDAGGTIDLLVDGDTVGGAKVNMLDNLTIDRAGRILLQEDTGGAAHNAKIWQYDIATDTLTLLARHDPTRFGDIGVNATAPFTIDEESSGIVDAQDVLGPGWFLLTVMAHYPLGGALVEGGQLLALYDAPATA